MRECLLSAFEQADEADGRLRGSQLIAVALDAPELRCTLDKRVVQRGAILWFIASALSFIAALLAYTGEGEIKWPLLAATFFMAAMGFSSLKRSKSDGA